MSTSTSSGLHPAACELPASSHHRTVSKRRLGTAAALPARSDADEAALWAHLENHEEGRVALEADHLFDTSYAWAV
jgi:hypothetical protein